MKKYMIIEGSCDFGSGSELNVGYKMFDNIEEVKEFMIEVVEDCGIDDFDFEEFVKLGDYDREFDDFSVRYKLIELN